MKNPKLAIFDERSEASLNNTLLGKWKRTHFFVEKLGELKHFDNLKKDYFFLFNKDGVLIESSNLSDDTLKWSLEMNPLAIILEVDEEKMNLNFSKTLFIEELNDTLLHVYSKNSKDSEAQENDFIKYHMKFRRIDN